MRGAMGKRPERDASFTELGSSMSSPNLAGSATLNVGSSGGLSYPGRGWCRPMVRQVRSSPGIALGILFLLVLVHAVRLYFDLMGSGDSLVTRVVQVSSSTMNDQIPPIRSGAKSPGFNPNSLRILVTGGAGFIGSHLVDRLMAEGHRVIVLDNLFTGEKGNLDEWLDSNRFEFVRHDVTDPYDAQVDQIYHLACPASPVHYKYDPVKTFKTSFYGTLNMLELAKRTNARMLFTSTSEVYGDPLRHPQDESYWGNVNPVGERSCYDEGKRVAETLITDYMRMESVDARMVRIFNTYGPRMALNDGRVVSNFVSQAIMGRNLTVQGKGSQTRSFCYVDDMVDGLIRTMNVDSLEGPVNIGNPREFTIKELAKVVSERVAPAGIDYIPLTSDDPQQRKPVIEKARKYLGWAPKVELEVGIVKMAENFRGRLSRPKL